MEYISRITLPVIFRNLSRNWRKILKPENKSTITEWRSILESRRCLTCLFKKKKSLIHEQWKRQISFSFYLFQKSTALTENVFKLNIKGSLLYGNSERKFNVKIFSKFGTASSSNHKERLYLEQLAPVCFPQYIQGQILLKLQQNLFKSVLELIHSSQTSLKFGWPLQFLEIFRIVSIFQ